MQLLPTMRLQYKAVWQSETVTLSFVNAKGFFDSLVKYTAQLSREYIKSTQLFVIVILFVTDISLWILQNSLKEEQPSGTVV